MTIHNNTDSHFILEEKLFKKVVAVDAIYGSRHGKYVSEVALAASSVKYSLARSHGLLLLAFDNEQRGQHNYLDRGYNKSLPGSVACRTIFKNCIIRISLI